MIYSLNNPYLPYAAERFRTGSYGEDSYTDSILCSECGMEIAAGEAYYDVHGVIFCMSCSEYASQQILDEVRENYIFEL